MHEPADHDVEVPIKMRLPDFSELPAEELVAVDPMPASATGAAEVKSFGFCFSGICFGYCCQPLLRLSRYQLDNPQPLVQLHFALRGNSRYTMGHSSTAGAAFSGQQHNVLFFPAGSICKELEADEMFEAIEISLSPALFLHYLPAAHPLFHTFRDSMQQNEAASLSAQNLSLTPRLSAVLQEMVHCRQQDCYKRLFIKAKVLELLSLQLEQFEQDKPSCHQNEPPHLKPSDLEKMYHARDILLRHLQTPYSLVELAHLVGTNEYYLKKHFKQVFGNTVFGYLHDHRMEQAKTELLRGEKKIAEIAAELGYKYPAHFSTAFKKHFGFLPQKMKKSYS